jgi:hypothetical protein
MRKPKRIIFLILATWFSSWVSMQAYGQPPSEASRDRVHELIVARLATGLNLSDSQAKQLGDILKKNWERKSQFRDQVQQLTTQLRQDTQAGDKKQTEATLKKLQEARDQLDRSDEVMFAEVKTLLDSNQLAQFVLIMDEIRHEIRAVRRRGPREIAPEPGSNPAFMPPQQGYTKQPSNQPYPPGYYQGYVPYPPPRPGVQVSD